MEEITLSALMERAEKIASSDPQLAQSLADSIQLCLDLKRWHEEAKNPKVRRRRSYRSDVENFLDQLSKDLGDGG